MACSPRCQPPAETDPYPSPGGSSRGRRRMTRRLLALVALALALTVLAAACGGGGGNSSGSFQGAPLTGAGSTFVQPVYQKWFHDFQAVESNAQINYQAIGSGGGITDLQQKTVDFADSDAPLQPTDMSAFPSGTSVVELPVVLGAAAVAYNVPGAKSGLKLDGPTT